MNLSKLKDYAPKARRKFIQAVTDRAAYYGLKQEGDTVVVLPITEKGDGVLIGGMAFPRKVAEQRKALEERVRQDGFPHAMEALAYTWFNRLVALRYMEVHGYLDHGYRVLSPSPRGGEGRRSHGLPEILEHAEHLDLPGLNPQTVIDLKIDGKQDAQLYRLLLLAQCNALHSTMPFIFPKIDDEIQLLLPDNLLHSDSLISDLVTELTEEDCASVEVLGWLYQFYIAEKKDAVMARRTVVPTEDIPAVTQLFTPHWIVRYLVENSLGRLWLLNRPGSRLREKMPYYIEGGPETDFLKITKPEDIRILDPAIGSGHMLTYAFDLLGLMYEEAGYAPSDIPALILRHNLHGLDICPRAAQLAALALVFKARAISRRFFQREHLVRPHVMELRNVHFADSELRNYIHALELGDLFNEPMLKLLHQFEDAKNFGSLIQPCLDEAAITFVRLAIEAKDLGGHLFLRETHFKVLRVLEQAERLTKRYHVVLANPPYMGSGGMNPELKKFAARSYDDSKSDLLAMFVRRAFSLCANRAYIAMVTLQNWMFISSFEEFREVLLNHSTIITMAQIGYNSFPEMNSKVAQACAFALKNAVQSEKGVYLNLNDAPQSADKDRVFQEKLRSASIFRASAEDFKKIPGCPVAYWVPPAVLATFGRGSLDSWIETEGQNKTADNDRYLRHLWEVSSGTIGKGRKWVPYAKGGPFRKWYGNIDTVVDWSPEARAHYRKSSSCRIVDESFWYREGISWTDVTSGTSAFRFLPEGATFDMAGPTAFFASAGQTMAALALLNTRFVSSLLAVFNPTLHVQLRDVRSIPLPAQMPAAPAAALAERAVRIARTDWDNFETSWDFSDHPLLRLELKAATLRESWHNWEVQRTAAVALMQQLETENNQLFIDTYGLGNELKPEVPKEQITLACADPRKDVASFLSYVVGCMMGRYSLDHPGLILANAGGTLGDFLQTAGLPQDKLTFVPDEDGIVPVLDGDWFDDDVVARTREFLRATFGEASLEANQRFIEESIGKDLRRYFLTDFYKDHLQTYKRRPIYWLFSSGKQRAFQCLVYMHRYGQSTLSRLRTEYVIPLQGRNASRLEQIEGDVSQATSTSQRKKFQKEQEVLRKQQAELASFDEKLKHAADQRIGLDLDDGVRANYGKFGDLLAEVVAVVGSSDE